MDRSIGMVSPPSQASGRRQSKAARDGATFARGSGQNHDDSVRGLLVAQVVAMLGILMCDGAYVPIDPTFPKGE
jgi:hypothetical protein